MIGRILLTTVVFWMTYLGFHHDMANLLADRARIPELLWMTRTVIFMGRNVDVMGGMIVTGILAMVWWKPVAEWVLNPLRVDPRYPSVPYGH
jgi:hypothetical protein